VHRRHTDAFYVLDGELELGLGPEVVRIDGTPGTLAAAPPNVVHTFRNASDRMTLFLNVHTPSMGFADMLRAAHEGGDADAAHFDQYDPPEDGGRPLTDAVLRVPGEGRRTVLEGVTTLAKAEGADADGQLSLVEVELGPGATYPKPAGGQVDVLYVLEGTVSLGAASEAGTGDVVVGPGSVRNNGSSDARLLHLSSA
jgi:quercetin dioxygenase-like cupin family protein